MEEKTLVREKEEEYFKDEESGRKWVEYQEDNLHLKSILLKNRYISIPYLFFMDRGISHLAREVLILLLNFIRENGVGKCNPLQANLAKMLNVSVDSIQRVISELKQKEWIETILVGYSAKNHYFLTLPSISRINDFICEPWGLAKEELKKLLTLEEKKVVFKKKIMSSSVKNKGSGSGENNGTYIYNNKEYINNKEKIISKDIISEVPKEEPRKSFSNPSSNNSKDFLFEKRFALSKLKKNEPVRYKQILSLAQGVFSQKWLSIPGVVSPRKGTKTQQNDFDLLCWLIKEDGEDIVEQVFDSVSQLVKDPLYYPDVFPYKYLVRFYNADGRGKENGNYLYESIKANLDNLEVYRKKGKEFKQKLPPQTQQSSLYPETSRAEQEYVLNMFNRFCRDTKGGEAEGESPLPPAQYENLKSKDLEKINQTIFLAKEVIKPGNIINDSGKQWGSWEWKDPDKYITDHNGKRYFDDKQEKIWIENQEEQACHGAQRHERFGYSWKNVIEYLCRGIWCMVLDSNGLQILGKTNREIYLGHLNSRWVWEEVLKDFVADYWGRDNFEISKDFLDKHLPVKEKSSV